MENKAMIKELVPQQSDHECRITEVAIQVTEGVLVKDKRTGLMYQVICLAEDVHVSRDVVVCRELGKAKAITCSMIDFLIKFITVTQSEMETIT